jgi:hypothetical protein
MLLFAPASQSGLADWRNYSQKQDRACGAANFSLDLGNTHCPYLAKSLNASSAAECVTACCDSGPGCETWEWCEAGAPCSKGFWFEPGALARGNDLAGWPQNTTIGHAEAACAASETCVGMTYHSTDPIPAGTVKIYLKTAAAAVNTDTTWSRQMKASSGCFLGSLHRAPRDPNTTPGVASMCVACDRWVPLLKSRLCTRCVRQLV